MVTVKRRIKTSSNTVRQKALVGSMVAAVLIAFLYLSYTAMYMIPLQKFAYYGTYSISLNMPLFVLGLVVCMAVGALLPREANALSYFIWFLFLTMIVPRLVIVGCRGDEPWYALLCCIVFAVAVCLGTRFGQWSLPASMGKTLSKKGVSIAIVASISAIVLALLVYMLITMGLPSLDAFDYRNTYDIRDENEESFGFVQSAMLSLAGTRIVPMLICFFLAAGLPWFALAATVAQLMLFLWTANKAWVLTAAIIWLLYFLIVKRWMSVMTVLSGYVVVMLIIAVASCAVATSAPFVVFSIFVRRLIFVPATIGDGYFHFFLEDNPLILFQSTVLSALTPMPDQYADKDFVVQIGQYLYGEKVITNANSGLFGGEIANFGPCFGFSVMALNLLLFCKLFAYRGRDSAGRYLDIMAIVVAFLLLNVSSTRFLFSPTGLVGTIILLALLFLADCGYWSKAPLKKASSGEKPLPGQ